MGIRNRLPLVGRSKREAFRVGGDTAQFPPPGSFHSPTSPQGGGEIVRVARTWIGTPYVHQASVKGVGCDCLGLLRGVWREMFGAEAEALPNYSPDWVEVTGEETLYMALARHAREIPREDIAPGDIALFRMLSRGPAKHCGIVAAKITSPAWGGRNAARVSGGGMSRAMPPSGSLHSPTSPQGGGEIRTLIHARQNKRVTEEPFTAAWQRRLAYAFRL